MVVDGFDSLVISKLIKNKQKNNYYEKSIINFRSDIFSSISILWR